MCLLYVFSKSDVYIGHPRVPIASKKTNPWDWTHLELIAPPAARLEIAARVDKPRPDPPCLGGSFPNDKYTLED